MSFGGEESTIAGVVGDTPLEAVQCVVADNFGKLRIGKVGRVTDLYIFAAISDCGREVVFHPLIAQGNAAARALFVPVAVSPREVRAAQPEADQCVPNIG